jgi:uncharacterized membrane protein YkoI
MKRLFLTLTTAAVLTTAGVATAYAVQSDDKPAPSVQSDDNPGKSTPSVPTGSLTAAKAAEQAVKDVPGGVVTDVEWDHTKWELDVRTTSGWRELAYDPNGKLLSNRTDDRADDRTDDRSDDHSDDSADHDVNDDHGGDRPHDDD